MHNEDSMHALKYAHTWNIRDQKNGQYSGETGF